MTILKSIALQVGHRDAVFHFRFSPQPTQAVDQRWQTNHKSGKGIFQLHPKTEAKREAEIVQDKLDWPSF